MNTPFILYYMLIFTAMTALLFVAYRLIFRSAENFKLQRFMLLSILGLSLLMPFNPIKIALPTTSLNIEKTFFIPIEQAAELETLAETETETTENFTEQTHPIPVQSTEKESKRNWSFATILFGIYLLVSFLLIVRLLLNIAQLIYWYYAFPKTRKGKYRLVQLPADKSTCSFFNCIFINENGLDESEIQQIIKHEKIHASQYHSLDILLIELIGAVMWFNPFIWSIKREIRLVHEYLADDEVPTSDSEKIRYQALLLNQATGGKIISFSSQFKQSIIKKRIMMMEKQKSSKKTGRKLLWFLPVVLLFVLGTACVNGQASNEKVKQEPVSATNGKLIETVLTKLFDTQVVDKTAVIDVNISDKANPNETTTVRQKCILSVLYNYNATDENDAILKYNEFKAYPEDSKRITEMLNQRLLDKNSSDKIWANFYYYENKRNPEKGLICLNIASTTNKVNKDFMDVISEYFQLKEKGISSDEKIWFGEQTSEKTGNLSAKETIIRKRKNPIVKDNMAETLISHVDKKRSFMDGYQNAIKYKSSLNIALFGNVTSDNQVAEHPAGYSFCKDESEQIAKILNATFEKNDFGKNFVKARFYVSENKNLPVLLNLGFNTEKLPYQGNHPIFKHSLSSLSEFLKDSSPSDYLMNSN